MQPKPIFKTCLRGRLADHSDHDHWSGGKPYHGGATCPSCKIPLLLLWDINCRDPRFPRGAFGSLDRLPLYFCWGCGDIAYQVIDSSRVRIHSEAGGREPSFPYDPYPESFERRGLLLLDGIPPEIPRLLRRMAERWDATRDDDSIPTPPPDEQEVLSEFFGHPVLLTMCAVHHQFGGEPIVRGWAEHVFRCPNPACTGRLSDRLRGRKRAMRFLAGILNDPWAGLPMIEPAGEENKAHWNYGVSVQFHICDCCWTIFACNCSD